MKAKILRITDRALMDLFAFGEHHYESLSAVPTDAKVTAMNTPFDHPHEIWLRIESEILPEVPPYDRLPFADPIIFKKI